jgi:hypothetical protein
MIEQNENGVGIAKKRGRPRKVDLKYDAQPLKKSKRAIDKIEAAATNSVAWGPEPTWTEKITKDQIDTEIGYAYNWYSVNASSEKLKKWTLEYLASIKFSDIDLEVLAQISETNFSTIGKVARCKLRGAPIPPKALQFVETHAKQLIRNEINQRSVSKVVIIPKAKKRFDAVQAKLFEAIEFVTDEFLETRDINCLADFEFERVVSDSGANASQVRGVLKAIDPRAQELQQSLSGDALLKEAYSHLTKKQITILIAFYTNILQVAIESAPKKQRKPRKKKKMTPERMLRKFQFKKEDSGLKVKSIDPQDIIGCDEFWTFNCKTRKIGFFKANDESGLSVKGTTIQNYDEEISYVKTLRKPEDVLIQVKSTTKSALKKFVAAIRSKNQFNKGRINNETLLLRKF